MIDPNSQTKVFHPKHIANTFQKYYRNLYNLQRDPQTPQPTEFIIQNFLDPVLLSTLFQDTLTELNPLLQAKNESPGPDGFSAEYYKTYHDILVPNLTNLFKEAASFV